MRFNDLLMKMKHINQQFIYNLFEVFPYVLNISVLSAIFYLNLKTNLNVQRRSRGFVAKSLRCPFGR